MNTFYLHKYILKGFANNITHSKYNKHIPAYHSSTHSVNIYWGIAIIPGLGRSSGEGNGNPLQYSCLENSMDRGTWWAAVHGVAKSWTRLKRLSSSSGKEHAFQCKRCGFDPRVGKIPWKRKWQPTPIFLSGKFHGQRSLMDYIVHGVSKSQKWVSMHSWFDTINRVYHMEYIR